MEITMIGDTGLRIRLSDSDLEKYDLNCASLDYGNSETRRALWSIFDEAKKETGFDAAAQRVSISVFPDKTGGCEIFVSGIGDGASGGVPDTVVPNTRLPGQTVKKGEGCFRFDLLEDLLRACQFCIRYYPENDLLKTRAYFLGGTYYLSFGPPAKVTVHACLKTGPLLEFGDPVDKTERIRLSEYGELICLESAAKTLGTLL